MNLKIKILLTCLIVTLVPLFFTGYLSYHNSRKALEQETYSYLLSLNQQKQARISQWLATGSRQLEILAGMLMYDEHVFDHITRYSISSAEHNGELHEKLIERYLRPVLRGRFFNELFILREPDGEVAISTETIQEGKVMADRPFFLLGREHTHVENIFYSMSIRQPTMVISTPLRNIQGELLAVLVGRLNLAELSIIMEHRTETKKTEDTYLVNNQNFFITEPRYDSNYALRKSVYTEGVKAGLRQENGIAWYADYRGEKVIGVHTYLPEYKLVLLSEIDQAEFMLPIVRIKNTAILIGVMTIIVVIIVSWIIAEQLYRPLRSLIESVERIDGSNLTFTNPLSGRDETARLARSFDLVTERLRHTMVSRDLLQKEIKHRREVEVRLKQALREAKRSNEELEQFAYVASHDLQEPLRMVSSYTQLLADRYQGQLDEKAQRFIAYAVDGAARMQNLIQDLLAFSRITTRGRGFELVDTRHVLDLTLQSLQMMIKEKRAVITSDELPVIRGDATQLGQLFQNLLVNGMKFCTEKTPRIHISAELRGDMYRFSFKDNGIGIEARFAERIFTIFQRLHTREEYSGTGIGLALCKRIVERHAGTIWYTSEPGNGTHFFFTLPNVEVLKPDETMNTEASVLLSPVTGGTYDAH